MEALIANSKELVGRTNIDLVRYIHDRIEWDARLVALVGARGVGKTTMLLQHIKMHDNLDEVLFVPADNLYFTNHTLLDLATMFYRRGGRKLYIDEIHRYRNWSQEIKNIYDMLPDLHVVYTGSSILDLEKGGADLSRRRLQYTMYGLSFREYIKLAYGIDVRVHSFDEILNSKIDFPYDKYRPLKLFDEYLKVGYYPFFADKGYHERLSNMLMQTLVGSGYSQFCRNECRCNGKVAQSALYNCTERAFQAELQQDSPRFGDEPQRFEGLVLLSGEVGDDWVVA